MSRRTPAMNRDNAIKKRWPLIGLCVHTRDRARIYVIREFTSDSCARFTTRDNASYATRKQHPWAASRRDAARHRLLSSTHTRTPSDLHNYACQKIHTENSLLRVEEAHTSRDRFLSKLLAGIFVLISEIINQNSMKVDAVITSSRRILWILKTHFQICFSVKIR